VSKNQNNNKKWNGSCLVAEPNAIHKNYDAHIVCQRDLDSKSSGIHHPNSSVNENMFAFAEGVLRVPFVVSGAFASTKPSRVPWLQQDVSPLSNNAVIGPNAGDGVACARL
jgi:hypothetical protein